MNLENASSRSRAFAARLVAIRRRVMGLRRDLRPMPTMLSLEEAAAVTGMPARRLRRLASTGMIAARKYKGRLLIPRSELGRLRR